MHREYKSTIQINCCKEHTCAGCGAVYSYPFVRTVTGSSRDLGQAQAQARKNAAETLRDEVERVPCPTCGLYQPDMVADRRRVRLLVILWLGFIVLMFPLLFRWVTLMQPNTATVVIGTISVIVFLAYLLVEWSNINRDPDANARRVAGDVASGKVRYTAGRSGPPSPEMVHPPKSIIHLLALPLILIGVALTVAPEILRARNHWAVNGDCDPSVVGPGDRTRVHMLDSVKSIKGYWRGRPTVTVSSDGGAKLDAAASTNQDDWGDTIRAKDDEKEDSASPYVELTMPEGIAGKSANYTIAIEIDYPSYIGKSQFEIKHSTMSRKLTLELAPAHAGARYEAFWWQLTWLGMALMLVGGILLVRGTGALRRRAIPARVLDMPQYAKGDTPAYR